MKFTANPKGIRIVLIVLLIVFGMGALGWCSKSDAQEGLSIGFGKASAGSDICFDSMMITQTIAEDRWTAYLATHGEAAMCHGEAVGANMGAGVIRTTHLGKFSIGFGAGVLDHGDIAVGPLLGLQQPPRTDDDIQLAAAILLRYRISKRFEMTWVHNSNGGSTKHNRGLNTLVLAVRL